MAWVVRLIHMYVSLYRDGTLLALWTQYQSLDCLVKASLCTAHTAQILLSAANKQIPEHMAFPMITSNLTGEVLTDLQ